MSGDLEPSLELDSTLMDGEVGVPPKVGVRDRFGSGDDSPGLGLAFLGRATSSRSSRFRLPTGAWANIGWFRQYMVNMEVSLSM